MNFPFETDEQIIEDVPREYETDFKTGKMTGRLVEGIDALKIWIYLALQVKRYSNVAHSWDYGQELDDLIGRGYSKDYVKAEVKRMVEECLLINEHIIEIKDLVLDFTGDTLAATFLVVTDLGEVRMSV